MYVFLMSTENKLIIILRAKHAFIGIKHTLIATTKEIEI